MARYSKLSESEWSGAIWRYQHNGISLKDCAIERGVSLETIRRGFLRRGVKLRPPHKTIGPTGRKPKYRD